MIIQYATYGRGTACSVFSFNGWYVVKGSKNINFCPDLIDVTPQDFTPYAPLNVEILADTDTMTSSRPVDTEYQLLETVAQLEQDNGWITGER